MSQNAIDWVQRSYARRGRSGDGRCHVLAVDTNAVYWGGTYPGRNPPNWRLVQNLCTSPVDILLDNEDGEAFRDDAASRCGNGPGFLSNRDIAYVFAPTSRGFGDVLVLRGRAPTFADTRPGPAVMPSGQQLRY
jgi:hypothetical protein